MAFALKSLTAAVASAVFLSSAASAAGLGKLTVLSGLGQPLRAEIELSTSSGEDPSSMSVKLASPEAFRSANIEFNPSLLSLRFTVENRGGRQVIRVNSTQPVNEPFVDMLLELSWNNGRLVREYTFLLDPPELRSTQPAQVAAAPAARSRSQTAATPAAPAAAATDAAPARAASAEENPSNYRVRRGDTLGRIAGRVKPADISLDMMLVALYRANPDAFIGNNMNRLKSGQILSVPDAGAIKGGASEGEARGVVVAHAADFDAYRNKLAGQVAASTPAAAATESQSASGRVTARVEERATAANESQDKLRLSKADAASAGKGQGGAASVEDKLAKQKELSQAEARVKELEKNVGQLENLMTVESRSGADAAKAVTPDAPAATPAVTADAAPAATPDAATPPPAAVPAATPAPRIRPQKVEEPVESSLADTLIDNFAYLAAGAGVLLLGGLALAQRRRRQNVDIKPVQAEPSVLGVPGAAASSLFAQSGGQSVDTNNSVFNSSFAPSASQLDTNEVDPVAEADVYIAYGRDAQAEEILKEALRVNPERHPVRLKLLEIYAARKDVRAFEVQARELHGLTRGVGEEWVQAAALGQGVDPTNALYANAGSGAAAAPQAPQAKLSQQFEDAFRGGAPVAAGAAAGLAAGAAATSLAKADERTATPQAEPTPEDNALDFDLGGLSFEPVTSNEPAAVRADPDATAVPDFGLNQDAPALQAKPADSFNELDFDINFDAAPSTASQPPVADEVDDFTLALSPQAQVQATPVDMAGLAKDFDGLPQTAAPAAASVQADPLFDLDTMDFGTPATPTAQASGAQEDPLFDLDTMDFGLSPEPQAGAVPSHDFRDPAAVEVGAAPTFDTPDFDLDLPGAEPALAGAGESEAGLSPEQMEMETKLDLAIAYQEIGDREGARELLDEVIKGGSSAQVSKASAMRDLLA